ncbi:MAG: hypothetical protein JO021_05180 [Alphaproteobacteria bacterium]|nr:hypothetical protein [Alphaproteobacteria bacterium]
MDDDTRRIRDQQHTGNHDSRGPDRYGGTRAGAENVEPVVQRDDRAAGPTLIVTRDDAATSSLEPEAYAEALAAKLRPYGVAVRFEPNRAGSGALIGVDDPKLEVDIRQAVAMVNSDTE